MKRTSAPARWAGQRVEVHTSAGAALSVATAVALAALAGGFFVGADDETAHRAGVASAEPVVLTDPTSCVIGHQGSPATPEVLTLECADAAWEASGPWVDRKQRDFAATDRGWVLTQGVVVGGDARLWFRGEDMECLATRDLLDTASGTRVRCDQVEPASPLPHTEPEATIVQA